MVLYPHLLKQVTFKYDERDLKMGSMVVVSRLHLLLISIRTRTQPKQKWHVGIRSVRCAKERRRVHIISMMALLVFNERAGSGRWKEVWCIEMVQNDIHDLGTVFICTESTNCTVVSSTYRKYSSRSSIHRIPPLLLQQLHYNAFQL
jgi:hypothetical protein